MVRQGQAQAAARGGPGTDVPAHAVPGEVRAFTHAHARRVHATGLYTIVSRLQSWTPQPVTAGLRTRPCPST